MKNNGVKFGLIYGVGSVILSLITYFTSPGDLMSLTSWNSILIWLLMLVTMFLAAKTTRDQKGGFIPFGEALIPPMITFILGMLISQIYMYVLTNFIDPSIQETIQQGALDMQRGILEMAGASEDQILEELENIGTGQENQFGLVAMLLSTLSVFLFMGLPISAIIAAIVKRKEPMIQQS